MDLPDGGTHQGADVTTASEPNGRNQERQERASLVRGVKPGNQQSLGQDGLLEITQVD
jgi:hypothetical protein